MKIKFLLLILLFGLGFTGYGQQLAFPGAEGYGKYTTGGRGGKVYEVTNLNDSGTGSLRAAIAASGPRIVIFKVSGTIALNSTLTISNNDITIAGQTAPGDGICIKNYSFSISADNVIVRFIRCRLGDEKDQEDDAMKGRDCKNVIIDHCSMSWSVDETASLYNNQNFTMQWCIISESLYHSVHEKGDHGYGGIWGGQGVTYHHNLLAHHTSRNPRFCGSRYTNQPEKEVIDHRNNVIYNWAGNSCYGAEGGSYNLVNNYYKYGPATNADIRNRIISPNADDGSNAQLSGVWGNFYVNGNYIWKNTATTEDNWKGVHNVSTTIANSIKLKQEVNMAVYSIETEDALDAYEHVLAFAGAILPKRDVVDTRIVMETRTGTATYGGSVGATKGIIDSPSDVGGWPELKTGTLPSDSDLDGIPDYWEDINGLNKKDPKDRNYLSENGYTYIEEYINSLVNTYAYVLRPSAFKVDSVNNKSVYLSWKDISLNETSFLMERRTDSSAWEAIKTIGADTTFFLDTKITEYGTYLYRMKAVSGTTESFYTDSISVLIEEDTTTIGINHSENTPFKYNVFPNPSNSSFAVQIELNEKTTLQIKLYDLKGTKIATIEQAEKQAGLYTFNYDNSALLPGVYYLNIRTNKHTETVKLIIN